MAMPRFIPAGAGNTDRGGDTTSGQPVHPRWRGEHIYALKFPALYYGSSPLARGTQNQRRDNHGQKRFIPAGAGNTDENARNVIEIQVHPRWRGEHGLHGAAVVLAGGSSPLARGTLQT